MLSDLLFQVAGFLRCYLAISAAQGYVLAAWVFHTHAIEAADRTPYLNISSPQKRSGKTLLLELLAPLVRQPWFTSNATTAALVELGGCCCELVVRFGWGSFFAGRGPGDS